MSEAGVELEISGIGGLAREDGPVYPPDQLGTFVGFFGVGCETARRALPLNRQSQALGDEGLGLESASLNPGPADIRHRRGLVFCRAG